MEDKEFDDWLDDITNLLNRTAEVKRKAQEQLNKKKTIPAWLQNLLRNNPSQN